VVITKPSLSLACACAFLYTGFFSEGKKDWMLDGMNRLRPLLPVHVQACLKPVINVISRREMYNRAHAHVCVIWYSCARWMASKFLVDKSQTASYVC